MKRVSFTSAVGCNKTAPLEKRLTRKFPIESPDLFGLSPASLLKHQNRHRSLEYVLDSDDDVHYYENGLEVSIERGGQISQSARLPSLLERSNTTNHFTRPRSHVCMQVILYNLKYFFKCFFFLKLKKNLF